MWGNFKKYWAAAIAHKLQRETCLSRYTYLIAWCATSAMGFTILRSSCDNKQHGDKLKFLQLFLKTKPFQRMWLLLWAKMVCEGFSEPWYTNITIQGFFGPQKPGASHCKDSHIDLDSEAGLSSECLSLWLLWHVTNTPSRWWWSNSLEPGKDAHGFALCFCPTRCCYKPVPLYVFYQVRSLDLMIQRVSS